MVVLDEMNIRLLKYVQFVIMRKVYIRLAKNLLMLLIQFRIIFKRQWEKIINQKNAFQIDDPDAPDNTQSVKIVKLKKVINGEERNITRKIYLLDNGKQHMVEIEDKD